MRKGVDVHIELDRNVLELFDDRVLGRPMTLVFVPQEAEYLIGESVVCQLSQ